MTLSIHLQEFLEAIIPTLDFAIDKVWEFGNSTFFTSLVGAFAGAYGGQFIVEKSKTREILLSEIRSVNAALALLSSIFNSYFALKKQYIYGLKEKFETQKSQLRSFIEAKRAGELVAQRFEFVADMRVLNPPLPPVERLDTLIFKDISVKGRAINLAVALTQNIQLLDEINKLRNDFIKNHRSNPPTNQELFSLIYFGIPDGSGHVDETYSSYIDGLYSYTDNCLAFSMLLYDDLHDHGLNLAKRLGKSAPKITEVKFIEDKLLPNLEEFQGWTDKFKKAE